MLMLCKPNPEPFFSLAEIYTGWMQWDSPQLQHAPEPLGQIWSSSSSCCFCLMVSRSLSWSYPKSLLPDPTATAMVWCHKQETMREVSLPRHQHPLPPRQLQALEGSGSLFRVKAWKRIEANPATSDTVWRQNKAVQVESNHCCHGIRTKSRTASRQVDG